MSVGIEDADFNRYIVVPFNLEAMKLSAYYKSKNNIVVLSPTFAPDRHEKYFFRKDYRDGAFNLEIMGNDKVEYGGLAFSNNLYVPLDESIEVMRPDTSLYERVSSLILSQKVANIQKIYKNQIEGEHARLSLDGKTIWDKYEKQFKNLSTCRNLMLHDYDLGKVDNSFNVVKDILANARQGSWATKIGMKFPVQIDDGQSLLNWSSLNSNSTFFSLKYTGVIDDDAFMQWIGSWNKTAIFTQIEYMVTSPKYTEEYFTSTLILTLLKQIIVARSFWVFYKIKYNPNFFTDKRWCQVLDLLNFYMVSYRCKGEAEFLRANSEDTVYDFVSHSLPDPKIYKGTEVLSRSQIRQIFEFVREKNYELFTMFYECSTKSLGGKL